jgi:uracil-DNA glycosylase family 4
MSDSLAAISADVAACRICPRLVDWRERVAIEKRRQYASETYWGGGVPGWGDPRARILIVGLAPAAHGANRTGRMFTGDRSGEWLYRALNRAGFSNRAESISRTDGLTLRDVYISAAVRCAPPENKPSNEEFGACRDYLVREIRLLRDLAVVIGLGKVGFDAVIRAFGVAGRIGTAPLPKFAHAVAAERDGILFLASYHPSQQNTFTGRLTEPMFDAVFTRARRALPLA